LKKNQFLQKTRSKSQKPTETLVILDFYSEWLVAIKKRKTLKKFEYGENFFNSSKKN
jgi:hypothetical protein